jgi:hypothetical protein
VKLDVGRILPTDCDFRHANSFLSERGPRSQEACPSRSGCGPVLD